MDTKTLIALSNINRSKGGSWQKPSSLVGEHLGLIMHSAVISHMNNQATMMCCKVTCFWLECAAFKLVNATMTAHMIFLWLLRCLPLHCMGSPTLHLMFTCIVATQNHLEPKMIPALLVCSHFDTLQSCWQQPKPFCEADCTWQVQGGPKIAQWQIHPSYLGQWQKHFLGIFATELEAAQAVDEAHIYRVSFELLYGFWGKTMCATHQSLGIDRYEVWLWKDSVMVIVANWPSRPNAHLAWGNSMPYIATMGSKWAFAGH